MEQMVYNLCKSSDKTKFASFVAAPTDCVVMQEMRDMGIPVYIGLSVYHSLVRFADIVNLHMGQFEPNLYSLVQSSGKSHVVTLHAVVKMPYIPAITICTGSYTYDIQSDKNRFVLISNGIDLSRFKPKAKKLKKEVIITRICRTARCALYFWQAMYKILNDYPQTRLWIVGNDTNLGENTDQIKFLGIRRDIPEILSETDIFAYTPFPSNGTKDLVVMEAMAMGVPCVVSDVCSVNESVEDGKSGFLTPYGNADAFAEKIRILIENVDLRVSMGENAVKFAQENFDMSKIIKRYEFLYEKILGRNLE
jgi:glycosyltransferase involved in cell wall biosynthesis